MRSPAVSRTAAKLGRSLGFPTANIRLRACAPDRPASLRSACTDSAARHATGVASIGVRPTVSASGVPMLEVFVFDFDESIYGRRISVEFLHKLRDEERYADLDALAHQIRDRRGAGPRIFRTACVQPR